MRILLSEGSGLTSRQVAGRLWALGHEVGVLSSEAIALTRMTRAVRHWHDAPRFGSDPLGWLETAIAVHHHHGYDLLLPTQEQVTVLSAAAERLAAAGVRTVVPPFAAVAAVQDKVAARATLGRLGLPQPRSEVLHSVEELSRWERFPVFAKAPIGTATSGVRHLAGAADRDAALGDPVVTSALTGDGLVVQDAVPGPLAMVQSVFDRGHLLAFHANLRVREGVWGGASHKRSIDLPEARTTVEALGAQLGWHGGLSVDVILSEDGSSVIDVNPRLVEPGNALAAGVDLVGALLDASSGGEARPAPLEPSVPGVATHQLLIAVLGAAQHGRRRRGVAAELIAAARHRGDYRDSSEELTPLTHDPLAAVPVVAAALATLAVPSTWRWFSSGSVASYSLSPEGWDAIRASVTGPPT